MSHVITYSPAASALLDRVAAGGKGARARYVSAVLVQRHRRWVWALASLKAAGLGNAAICAGIAELGADTPLDPTHARRLLETSPLIRHDDLLVALAERPYLSYALQALAAEVEAGNPGVLAELRGEG